MKEYTHGKYKFPHEWIVFILYEVGSDQGESYLWDRSCHQIGDEHIGFSSVAMRKTIQFLV